MNKMKTEFWAIPENESFARVVVAGFLVGLNPTVDELSDVKTAVSEAVTNAIIHGYEKEKGMVSLSCEIQEQNIVIVVEDKGVGISDISLAMEPMYTTKPELERSGMGFAFMEAFMDKVEVSSAVGEGTRVRMEKSLSR